MHAGTVEGNCATNERKGTVFTDRKPSTHSGCSPVSLDARHLDLNLRPGLHTDPPPVFPGGVVGDSGIHEREIGCGNVYTATVVHRGVALNPRAFHVNLTLATVRKRIRGCARCANAPCTKTEPAQNIRQHEAEGEIEGLTFGAKINLTSCGACNVAGDCGV